MTEMADDEAVDETLAAIAMAHLPDANVQKLVDKMVLRSTSKYSPHCGKRQQARYLRQIASGVLKGAVIDTNR